MEESVDDKNKSTNLMIFHDDIVNKNIIENEDDYKQTIYTLSRKKNSYQVLIKELQENNDSLEQSLQQHKISTEKQIQQINELHKEKLNEMSTYLNELIAELNQKTEQNKLLNEKLNQINENLLKTNYDSQPYFNDDDDDNNDYLELKIKVEELSSKLAKLTETKNIVESEKKSCVIEINELSELLKITKEELAEKNQILQCVRDEFMECKMELDALKNLPTNNTTKGNSLFSEVEDNRKKYVTKMEQMKINYYEMKNLLNIKDNENKKLKAERTALLNKWQNEKDGVLEENWNLKEAYEKKINKLELELKENKLKYKKLEKQMMPKGEEFCYFQSELERKNIEIEDLENQLKSISINTLFEAEKRHNLSREVRMWRNKAELLEAQIDEMKSIINLNSSTVNKDIVKIFDKENNINPDPLDLKMSEISMSNIVVVDENVLSFKELIQPLKLENSDNNKMGNLTRLLTETTNISKLINVNEMESKITFDNNNEIEKKDKTKKTLKFTEETVDHPEQCRKSIKRDTLKYPIIHVSSSKKKGD